MRLKPPNDKSKFAKMLFPQKGDKLSKFIMDTFKQIPFLENEPLGIRYIRHSLIRTKLIQMNPNSTSYAEQVPGLAELSMHSVSMQSVYKSNTKDKNENIINTKEQMDALKIFERHDLKRKKDKKN